MDSSSPRSSDQNPPPFVSPTAVPPFYLSLSAATVLPGHPLTGSVHLNPPSSLQADSIVFTLIQEESCEFPQDGSPSKSTTSQDRVEVARHLVNLSPCRDLVTVRSGFVFPFSILLPTSLAGAVTIDIAKSRGKVGYLLTARLQASEKAVAFAEVEVDVTQVVPRHIEKLVDQSEFVVGKMCCFTSTTRVRVRLRKDTVRPGDTVPVEIEVDNRRSWVGIASIRLSFAQCVILHSPTPIPSSKSHLRILAEQSFVSPVAPRQTRNFQYSISLPSERLKTTKSRLMDCGYKFVVGLVTEKGMRTREKMEQSVYVTNDEENEHAERTDGSPGKGDRADQPLLQDRRQ